MNKKPQVTKPKPIEEDANSTYLNVPSFLIKTYDIVNVRVLLVHPH